MAVGMETREFRSPVHKLLRFFRRSRDNWKRKHQKVKRLCKKLTNQVAAVEKSRDRWKSEVKQLRARVQELESERERQKALACQFLRPTRVR
jgi:polyhydroxyalkanoate synthesis regulator phasin